MNDANRDRFRDHIVFKEHEIQLMEAQIVAMHPR